MTGFAGDGKKTKFWLPHGETYVVRNIRKEEVAKFMMPQLLILLGCVLGLLLVLTHAYVPHAIGGEFLAAFTGYGGFALFVTFGLQFREGGLLPWKETLVFLAATQLLWCVSRGGMHALLADDNTLLAAIGLALALGWYLYYAIARLVWEPLMAAVWFMEFSALIAFRNPSTIFIAALFAAGAVMGLVFSATVASSAERYQRGFNRLPEY